MNKARENFLTMWHATRYSFAFCWKHDRPDTIARLLVIGANTCVLYLGMISMAAIISAVQHANRDASTILLPVAFYAGVQLLDLLTNRAQAYYQSKWGHELRSANQHDLNLHRGSLDIACFSSKKYDDVDKQIRELPYSWGTRVQFSEQMLMLLGLLVSFVVFGTTLARHKPLYALILAVLAIPKLISEFGLVSMWWNLYESHLPHFKAQEVLMHSFREKTSFIQAKIFNQLDALGKIIWSRERKILDSYNAARKEVANKKMLPSLVAIIGIAWIAWNASKHTILTSGSIGDLSVILASARVFQGNLNSMLMLMADQWNSARGVILIEREFKGLKPLLQTLDPIVPSFVSPHIRFDRVSFAYPSEPEKEVLHEVSFEIESGTKVAIVGKSGNGKSTLQALLMRHFDPTKGAIYADDINLRNLEPEVWNEYACSLTQDYRVHARIVAEEIASSRLGAKMDLARVQASAVFAHFHEVVLEDPLGYGKQIGSDFDGREFSGGEKQRLSLARAHYRDTPILIFDEPDARLDPESAEKIMENIFAIEGKTVIIITHHVSRAAECDKVIVMGKGIVLEQGSPAELLTRGGAYAKMCESDKKRLGTYEAEA